MNTPQKPRSDGINGWIRKFFSWQKQKPLQEPRSISSRQRRANTTSAIKQNSVATASGRFRTLTSNTETYSPQTNRLPTPLPSVTRPLSVADEIREPLSEPGPNTAAPAEQTKSRKPFFDTSKIMPTFWTIGSLLSFSLNIILIGALILLGRELFVLKAMVGNNLLGGLYENFIYMDQAHIKTNITVTDTIPINFTLPISQDTVVVLTQNTPINGAHVTINTGGISINSSANIVLPAGTNLPVHLTLQVPVNTTVPVKLNVPVDIPLQETDLHKPFIGLQQVVAPFYFMLQPEIKKPQDLPLCGSNPVFCSMFFHQ